MAKITYQGSFSYADADPAKGTVSQGGTIPVKSFAVLGSAVKNIDLGSTEEMDIASALKQVEQSKAFYIFIPATRGLEIVDLTNYSRTPDSLLKIDLMVTAFSDKTQTKSLSLVSTTASIGPFLTANKIANTVQVQIYLKDAKLRYTSHTVKVLDRHATVIYSKWKDF
jgi:hypothetical protein